MDLEAILRLMQAADKTTFDKLEITDEDFELKLERTGRGFAPVIEGSPLGISAPQRGGPVGELRALDEQMLSPTEIVEDEFMNTKEITSPLIGVFHQLPDGKALKAGDKVKKGDIICMVEAMKLMNEIFMPEDGEIVWVAVNDDTMVEYGDLLFRYV